MAPIDLYKANVAIQKRLNDPALLKRSKAQLQEGNIVQFFSGQYECMREGTIFELFQKYAGVEDHDTKERWKIPYYAIDLHHIKKGEKPTHAIQFKVGDKVLFKRQGVNGMIAKLNKKTATVLSFDGNEYLIPYRSLEKM
ncbi:hypothetical protein DA717_12395 [Piscirickettsiaceae bacterium NZ-RLO2]|nr:hypothetical protein DA717_12395 [Piscirickettsiaceae bacterium NZ-RLO2]